MSRRDLEHVADLLAEHSLGVLRGAELRRVERHLRHCAACGSELAAWQEVADQLACVPAPVQPPPALIGRILDRLPAPAALHAGGRLRGVRLSPGWAALVLVALLASIGANIALWLRTESAEGLLTDPSAVHMVATQAALGAGGRLVPSMNSGRATLLVEGLPGLPPGSQYQLWLIRDGARTSGGVFSVDREGCAVLFVNPPAPLSTYSGFGITVEPAGGSPGPTGVRVLRSPPP